MIPRQLNNFAGHLFLLVLGMIAVGQGLVLALYLLVSFAFWDWATWSWAPFRVAALVALIISVRVSFDPDFWHMSRQAQARGSR